MFVLFVVEVIVLFEGMMIFVVMLCFMWMFGDLIMVGWLVMGNSFIVISIVLMLGCMGEMFGVCCIIVGLLIVLLIGLVISVFSMDFVILFVGRLL